MAVDLSGLRETGWFSDLSIVVSGQTIRVHKNILAARSTVFAAMLLSDMVEADTNTICMDDVEADVVQAMLQFIYSGRVDKSTADTYRKLMYCADKYNLDALLAICERELAPMLAVSNAAGYLQLADLHHARRLKATAAHFIRSNLDAVQLTAGWRTLSGANSALIVEAVVNTRTLQTRIDILGPITPVTRINSTVEVLEGRCQWRINNFSFLNCKPGGFITSPPFKCAGNEELEWVLRLCPPYSDKPTDVGFFLKLSKSPVPVVRAEGTMSIHVRDGDKGKVHSRKLDFTEFVKPKRTCGWRAFLTRPDALKPTEFMFGVNKISLEDNVMALSCNVSASLGGEISTSETTTVS